MTRRDTPSYKLEAGQSGLKVPPETETGRERERDCGGSKVPLTFWQNALKRRQA